MADDEVEEVEFEDDDELNDIDYEDSPAPQTLSDNARLKLEKRLVMKHLREQLEDDF